MKRKSFLGSMLGGPLLAAASFHSDYGTRKEILDDIPWRIPPYLKPGDTIGITCPAGFMTLEEIQPAVQIIKSWGFNLRIGRTVGSRDFIFGGTDAERLADLQQMLDDPVSPGHYVCKGWLWMCQDHRSAGLEEIRGKSKMDYRFQ